MIYVLNVMVSRNSKLSEEEAEETFRDRQVEEVNTPVEIVADLV